jgi:molecular chaperone GrpE
MHPDAPLTETDREELQVDDAGVQVELDERDALVEELTRERDELQSQLLRSIADLQNFRRRVAHEKDEIRKYATESLVANLLPVLDNFERTVAASERGASPEALLEGVRLVERQLRGSLESVHVRRIIATGVAFNPDEHEAVTTEATEAHPEGTVLEELEAGYKIGDRVIRPARVKVAKKP